MHNMRSRICETQLSKLPYGASEHCQAINNSAGKSYSQYDIQNSRKYSICGNAEWETFMVVSRRRPFPQGR